MLTPMSKKEEAHYKVLGYVEQGGNLAKLSRDSGVSYDSMVQFKNTGKGLGPENLQKLTDYFDSPERAEEFVTGMIEEAAVIAGRLHRVLSDKTRSKTSRLAYLQKAIEFLQGILPEIADEAAQDKETRKR
jgi:hypothetical protein